MKHLKEVIERVAEEYGLTYDALIGRRRTKTLARARTMAMYLCRVNTDASYIEIAEAFGRTSHDVVFHACKRAEKYLLDNNYDVLGRGG